MLHWNWFWMIAYSVFCEFCKFGGVGGGLDSDKMNSMT